MERVRGNWRRLRRIGEGYGELEKVKSVRSGLRGTGEG